MEAYFFYLADDCLFGFKFFNNSIVVGYFFFFMSLLLLVNAELLFPLLTVLIETNPFIFGDDDLFDWLSLGVSIFGKSFSSFIIFDFDFDYRNIFSYASKLRMFVLLFVCVFNVLFSLILWVRLLIELCYIFQFN